MLTSDTRARPHESQGSGPPWFPPAKTGGGSDKIRVPTSRFPELQSGFAEQDVPAQS